MTDLTTATATELHALYQSGAASPVTVAQQILDKIARINPSLNAFCFIDPNTTMAQAQASEQRWQQAQPLSVFDGIPISIKDSILTQGWPTLHASHTVDVNQPWLQDAPLVAKLRDRGAVFVGKTTMSEFGITDKNSNSLKYGQVYNPWNIDYSPGGSSGGGAISVATGMVAISLVTDFGGSVSVPSAWCGVVGYKPTNGAGITDIEDVLQLSTVGIMARTVSDIDNIINFVAQPKIKHQQFDLSDTKIAVVDLPSCIHSKTVVEWLTSQAIKINIVNLPLQDATEIFSRLWMPKIKHRWQSWTSEYQTLTGKDIQRQAVLSHVKDQTYEYMIKRQELVKKIFNILQNYDYVMCPPVMCQPYQENDMPLSSPWSALFALTKQPTITVPIGIDGAGMPVAVMIAGKINQDQSLINFAKVIAQRFVVPAIIL